MELGDSTAQTLWSLRDCFPIAVDEGHRAQLAHPDDVLTAYTSLRSLSRSLAPASGLLTKHLPSITGSESCHGVIFHPVAVIYQRKRWWQVWDLTCWVGIDNSGRILIGNGIFNRWGWEFQLIADPLTEASKMSTSNSGLEASEVWKIADLFVSGITRLIDQILPPESQCGLEIPLDLQLSKTHLSPG